MSDYKDRMRAELAELSERMRGLEIFLLGPVFVRMEKEDKNLLLIQHRAMNVYRCALAARVERLK